MRSMKSSMSGMMMYADTAGMMNVITTTMMQMAMASARLTMMLIMDCEIAKRGWTPLYLSSCISIYDLDIAVALPAKRMKKKMVEISRM